ncbi:hypothetical protein SBA3_830006 [Candidatus Sulfopaludibacter sp. SbA3]|nr:hypothetical protein SBA3_830006 [Candidatus Sulfopaludibacter sp. SbA3]
MAAQYIKKNPGPVRTPQTRATLENPEPCVRRKPCQARNSPPFGESSCLTRVCPSRNPDAFFTPGGGTAS